MSVPTEESRRSFALEYLRLANENYRAHYAQRIYFARLARDHGLTYREIGDAYGVTDAAVRMMLKRAEVKA